MNYLKTLGDAIDSAVPNITRRRPDANKRQTGSQVTFEVVDADVQPDETDRNRFTACSNILFMRLVDVNVYFRVAKSSRLDDALRQQAEVMPLVYAALRNTANWGGLQNVIITGQWSALAPEDGGDTDTTARHVSTLPVRVHYVI